jgi:predicted RNase H-like HicB family nuclease
MRYPIAIEPGTEASAFGVVVPDLPGCFSACDSLDEAISAAEEAAAAWMRARGRLGRVAPASSHI